MLSMQITRRTSISTKGYGQEKGVAKGKQNKICCEKCGHHLIRIMVVEKRKKRRENGRDINL